jgi:hypothetical protein
MTKDLWISLILLALFVIFAMPFAVLFLPIVIPILVVLYLKWDRTNKRLQQHATKRLNGKSTVLDVKVSSLVLNDWGVFYAAKQTVEMAWDEILTVEEIHLYILEFRSTKQQSFQIDLSQERYLEVIWAIHSKIPNRSHFLIDPETGNLQVSTYTGHSFVLNDNYMEHKGNRMPWSSIQKVRETYIPSVESETNPYWILRVEAIGQSIEIKSTEFCDGPQLWDTDYDLIKCIIHKHVRDRCYFQRRLPGGHERAKEEYARCEEIVKGLDSIKVQRNPAVRENYVKYMKKMADKFGLVARHGI